MKPETLRLWDEMPPSYLSEGEIPEITYYAAENKRGRGAVVIFAGGAYRLRSAYEDEGYALFLNRHGVDAFVVKYRVAPTRFPYELLDARRAVRFVRANAQAYGIDPHKIAVMGSSAGGHLAALVSTYRGTLNGEGVDALDEVDYRPNATILCYPVINGTEDGIRHLGSFENLLGKEQMNMTADLSPELIADEQTPPAFLWHTAADSCVNVINSYRYATKLRELNIPVEMHIFPFGPHGLGLADEGNRAIPYVARWGGLLIDWLKLMTWIGE